MEKEEFAMRFITHVIMFGMALSMALSLPCSDHPEIWQDDGYGGKIWTVNPDCYQKGVTNTSPTQADGLPSTIDSNDTITEYEAYEEEYDELGSFAAGIIDVIGHLQVNIDKFCLNR